MSSVWLSGRTLLLILLAYLLGSIPFGLILARIFAKADVRQAGSNERSSGKGNQCDGRNVPTFQFPRVDFHSYLSAEISWRAMRPDKPRDRARHLRDRSLLLHGSKKCGRDHHSQRPESEKSKLIPPRHGYGANLEVD